MEDARNLLMQPDNAEPSSPLGGLASQAMGGLSKFANNVNKGIEAVLSHPLYARAWSGMVSAQASDPMAGPMALQQLQQSALQQRMMKQELDAANTPTLQDELAQLRLDRMRKRDAAQERLRDQIRRDPRNIDPASLYDAYPDEFIKSKLAPTGSGKLVQAMRNGVATWVPAEEAAGLQPVPRAPLVQNNVGTGMTNATTTKVQGQQLDAQDTLARLESIGASFKPEFLNWGSKLSQRWMAAKESAGASLSDDEKRQLTDMSGFQASAYENMSKILNQLSGAAISPAEFERLKRFLPNVGSGVFDGDSPTEFQAKLGRFDRSVRAAVKRYEYAQTHGLQSGGIEIPLDQFGVTEPAGGSSRTKPDGVPDGSRYDDAGRMWITPDGRVLVED